MISNYSDWDPADVQEDTRCTNAPTARLLRESIATNLWIAEAYAAKGAVGMAQETALIAELEFLAHRDLFSDAECQEIEEDFRRFNEALREARWHIGPLIEPGRYKPLGLGAEPRRSFAAMAAGGGA